MAPAWGAWLRWALGTWLDPPFPTVPLGTLSANLLGGEIEFILTNEMADRLLESLRRVDLSLVCARMPPECGVIGLTHKSRIPL